MVITKFGAPAVQIGYQVTLEGGALKGDVNLDGSVNLLDVSLFVDRIANGQFQLEADCNCDGFVNLLDVATFIDILAGN